MYEKSSTELGKNVCRKSSKELGKKAFNKNYARKVASN